MLELKLNLINYEKSQLKKALNGFVNPSLNRKDTYIIQLRKQRYTREELKPIFILKELNSSKTKYLFYRLLFIVLKPFFCYVLLLSLVFQTKPL